MERSQQAAASLGKQVRLLLVLVVLVGLVLSIVVRPSRDPSAARPVELVAGTALGGIYLYLAASDRLVVDRLPVGWGKALFFAVECLLVFGVGMVLGTGGSWLIGMPLVGLAVEMLTPRQRWPVYGALVAAMVLPHGIRYGAWLSALASSATGGAAVFFVAVFSQLRLDEQQARERAEQLMADLEAANQQLAAYATQAEELAMTQERNRLAREIHDNLGHTLTIVNVQIEAARAVLESDPARAMAAMDRAQESTREGLTRVRESVAALRESPVGDRPLAEAIAGLVEEARSGGIVTEFKVSGEPAVLRRRVALALYRAAQEALTNVRRHARASRVDVGLEFRPGGVSLEVKDNGVGATETGGGFGLLGIRERMQLLGGRLEIDTGPGQGFRLTASVPLAEEDRPDRPRE